MNMHRNMGTFDRWVRIVCGTIILSFLLVGPQSLWGLIGAFPLLTGVAAHCPFYAMFNFRTNFTKRARHSTA